MSLARLVITAVVAEGRSKSEVERRVPGLSPLGAEVDRPLPGRGRSRAGAGRPSSAPASRLPGLVRLGSISEPPYCVTQ